MADKSAIEWTDATWNPIVGCSIVSPGCVRCYAMRMAARIEAMGGAKHYAGTTQASKAGAVWTGKLALAPERIQTQPLRWKEPRRIFVNSMGDLFHEDVPDEWIDQVFAVMAVTPHHTHQVLTKRANRMRRYLADPTTRRRVYDLACSLVIERQIEVVLMAPGIDERHAPPGPRVYLDRWPLPNVWLGVSAERQQEADERIPELLATPAAVRFVSAEPLLGPIDFTRLSLGRSKATGGELAGYDVEFTLNALTGAPKTGIPALDWIIVGGESGPGARGMHPAWARSIRDQCRDASTAFFFKQWGAWAPSTPEAASGNPRSGWRCLAAHPHVARAQELYPEAGAEFIANVGKKAAGRLLDGIEHNGMPQVPA